MSANNTAVTKSRYWRIRIGLPIALCFVAGAVGCVRASAKALPPAPLSVPVSYPIECEVADTLTSRESGRLDIRLGARCRSPALDTTNDFGSA